jgi:phospholipid-binding lipoprotein MlaA
MGSDNYKGLIEALIALGLTLSIVGCATTQTKGNNDNNDPLEGFNRAMYNFNDKLDRYFFTPIARKYVEYTPKPVRTSVTNFFSNILTINTMINDFLQGKADHGMEDLGRIIINSAFGVGGLFDPATGLGIPKHKEDFGQTLGVWGAGEGAYLVLPFLGPSSVRDAPGLGVSVLVNPGFYISSTAIPPIGALGIINERANLLEATRIRDEAALDPYVFTREAYLQKRLSDIYDGAPPTEDIDENLEEEEVEEAGEAMETIE